MQRVNPSPILVRLEVAQNAKTESKRGTKSESNSTPSLDSQVHKTTQNGEDFSNANANALIWRSMNLALVTASVTFLQLLWPDNS